MEAPNIHRSPEVNFSRKSNLIFPLIIIANTPKIQIKTPRILIKFIFSLKKIVEIKIINIGEEEYIIPIFIMVVVFPAINGNAPHIPHAKKPKINVLLNSLL